MLFCSSDIKQPVAQTASPALQAEALHVEGDAAFISDADRSVLGTTIGELQPGKLVWFKTDGAWSNIHLLQYILKITGPAKVYFSTWAINEEAITRMMRWKEAGAITDIYAVIDSGLRSRKPAIYNRAVNAFAHHKIAHCHAKATVVISGTHAIAFIGSANYTENPRIEVGTIIWDKEIANANKNWIMEVIGHD